jgi:hypothetical protein
LRDFLDAAAAPDGKSLNGLDFPLTSDPDYTPFATDKVIWQDIRGIEFCKDEFPTTTKRWGLCATAGSFHKAHIDAEGEGTYIKPDSGVKIWLIAVPLKPCIPPGCQDGFDEFADANLYFKKYNDAKANIDRFIWHAIVLRPGMQL